MAQSGENPTAGKKYIIDSASYNRLLRDGYSFIGDPENNTLSLTQKDLNILGIDVPNIGVEPIKPTKFQQLKSKVVEKAGKMKNWLGKKANAFTDWISIQKDKVVKKISSQKVAEPKNTKYNGDIITQSGRAFKNAVSEYEIKIINKKDPLIQMQQADNSIKTFASQKLDELQGLKFNIGMEAILQKVDGDTDGKIKVHRQKFIFIAKAQTITNKSEISNAVQAMNDNIQKRIDEYVHEGSGWTLEEITKHFMRVHKYTPLAAKSYIKLPDVITNRKATINIQNKDDKCFMYCLGRALDPNPEKHHLERVNKHLKDVCHELGLDKIKMPVSMKDIPKIERDFNTSINVFGHNGGDIHPLSLTKLTGTKHVDLLVTSDATTNHYVLIKDFSKLCSKVTKSHAIKYFCKNCIQHFSSEEILERHKPNCMLVNGKQAVDLPKEGSKVKFNHLQRLVPVPFVIYADLEALLVPIENCTPNNNASYTVKTHKHEACSYGYKVVCSENDKYSKPFQMFRGEGSVYKFFEALFEEEKEINEYMKRFYGTEMILTKKQKKEYNEATKCYVCEENFTDEKKSKKFVIIVMCRANIVVLHVIRVIYK